jgi:uncharacterized phage infection (PIP) family protein YhgE
MANLNKLDETISDLEKQAEMLKQNNKVLAKVADLSSQIDKGVNELVQGNKNFDTVKTEIHKSLTSLNNEVTNIEKQNEKHIDTILNSNKKFLREFEETVTSKIERFSSDIQVTIRQERTQLQESLQNNITNQFNNLESKQKELFNQQTKQISLLRTLLLVTIVLCIGLGIASQRILQAHLKTAQATAQTKVFKRACKADPKEKLN